MLDLKKNSAELLENFPSTESNFKVNELKDFQNRFISIANDVKMPAEMFIEKIPELGFKYSTVIGDIIAKLIGVNQENYIFIDDYIQYMQLSKENNKIQKCNKLLSFFSLFQQSITEKSFIVSAKKLRKCYNRTLTYNIRLLDQDIKQIFIEIDTKQDNAIDCDELLNAYNLENKIIKWADFFLFNAFSFGSFNKGSENSVENQLEFYLEISWLFSANLPCNGLLELSPEEMLRKMQPPAGNKNEIKIPTKTQLDLKQLDNDIEIADTDLIKPIEKILKIMDSVKIQQNSPNPIQYSSRNSFQNSSTILQFFHNSDQLLFIFLGIQRFNQISPSPSALTKVNLSLPLSPSLNQNPHKLIIHYPHICSQIREKDSITSSSYINSFAINPLIEKLIHPNFSSELWILSSGKSKSFFYITEDKKYLLKTVRDSEFKFLLNILPEYSSYLCSNPDSLISKIYGIYTIKQYKGKKTIYEHFIIMNYVFSDIFDMNTIIDLKGSKSGRNARNNEWKTTYLWDNDFEQAGIEIKLKENDKEELINRITKDTQFLKSIQAIDYSVLIGFHEFNESMNTSIKSINHCYLSIDMKYIYYFGIIDILSVYNIQRKLENFFKTRFISNEVSCIPPDEYSNRLASHIKNILYN